MHERGEIAWVNNTLRKQQLKGSFLRDLEGQFSLPFVVGDGEVLFDDLVDDHELVDDDLLEVDGDDDRGVTVPGQVHGVCRCTL